MQRFVGSCLLVLLLLWWEDFGLDLWDQGLLYPENSEAAKNRAL
jgi:hypothetical protein